MSLSLDTNATVGRGFSGTNSDSANLSTSTAGDIIVVVINVNGVSTPTPVVTSVTSPDLTFAKRAAVQLNGANAANGDSVAYDNTEVWWAYSSGILSSETITVTTNVNVDAGTIVAFGITGFSGTYYQTNPWDTNSSLPAYNTNAAPNIELSVSGVSTTNANTMLLVMGGVNNGSSFDPFNVAPGWTLFEEWLQFGDINYASSGAYGQAVSSVQSNITVSPDITNTFQSWMLIADALVESPSPPPPSILALYEIDCIVSHTPDGIPQQPAVKFTRTDPAALPRIVEVQYSDKELDYAIVPQQAVNQYGRLKNGVPEVYAAASATQKMSITSQFGIMADEAITLAYDLLYRVWTQSLIMEFEHPDLRIESGDSFTMSGNNWFVTGLVREQIWTKNRTNQIKATVLTIAGPSLAADPGLGGGFSETRLSGNPGIGVIIASNSGGGKGVNIVFNNPPPGIYETVIPSGTYSVVWYVNGIPYILPEEFGSVPPDQQAFAPPNPIVNTKDIVIITGVWGICNLSLQHYITHALTGLGPYLPYMSPTPDGGSAAVLIDFFNDNNDPPNGFPVLVNDLALIAPAVIRFLHP